MPIYKNVVLKKEHIMSDENNNIKENFFYNLNYSQAEIQKNIENQNKERYKQFKERIAEFASVSTLKEAKELAKKILPTAQTKNRFKVGNATCVIIDREDMFRICLDSEKEFISYDFVK
jgi:hypothetical protein